MNATQRPGMPFANSQVARYLDHQIEALKGLKTQREIAHEIGYDKPNMISMFKRGKSRCLWIRFPSSPKPCALTRRTCFGWR